MKKAGHQQDYEKDDDFNALIRRISALPFTKPVDLDEAFIKFRQRADKLEKKRGAFSHELINYAQVQWRERFSVQDWNLYDINCLMVPSTNNGNEGANGRFLVDFGVHPPFWSFCLDACEELERVTADIPSILYASLVPPETPLYSVLKEQREIAKANYEAGLIDLDGYLGKVGAISLSTGKAKFSTDTDEVDNVVPKRKALHAADQEPIDDEQPPSKKRKVGAAAIKGRRGRPAKNTGKTSRNVAAHSHLDPVPNEQSSVISLSSETAALPSTTANLPWPNPRGLQSIPAALPATSSRTTSSAVPRLVSPQLYLPPVPLSSIVVFNDSLHEHIEKYNLGLRERSHIAGDGNCWFSSNADLAKAHKLKVPEDPNELRLAVANSLKSHPQKSQWIQSLFQGKSRSFNRFIKEHSIPGTFVDNLGLLVTATADYLDVIFHIVGTSNNDKDPFTTIGNKEGRNVVFHLGYYQDQSDEGGRAGHYQSLEPIPKKAVPCCKIPAAIDTVNDYIEVRENDEDKVEMLKGEEKILKSFANDGNMVKLSLKRLENLKCVSSNDLFCSNILSILYNDVRPNHSPTSLEGKSCRRLLKKFQRMISHDPDYDGEELPPLTDVSDDDSNNSRKKKNFRSLFDRRTSRVVAEMGASSSIRDFDNGIARASSTLIAQLLPGQESEGSDVEEDVEDLNEETIIPCIRPARRKTIENQQKKIPQSAIFESNSIELTPPPPCSPATPTRRGAASTSEPSVKRGRGRPRIASNVNSVGREPVKKKGRGRPRMTVSTSSASENTDPVVKRGRGMPRK